jgi:hypothetical protein
VDVASWGTAIFSDDLAADIRGYWRDGIIDGEDPADVTRQLVNRYASEGGDPDERIVFWLALAAAQMETGRLDPAVRDHALALIDAGGDVARWREQDESLARQREKALVRLAEKLRGPQPKPKRIRRTSPPALRFDVGDAVHLRMGDGWTNLIAIVIANTDGYPRGNIDPVVELVIWEEDRPPTATELSQLPCVLTEIGYLRADRPSRIRPHLFVLLTPTKKQRFGTHIGEIVARGVSRTPPGDLVKNFNSGAFAKTYTTWEGLIQIIGGDKFQHDLDLSRRAPRIR